MQVFYRLGRDYFFSVAGILLCGISGYNIFFIKKENLLCGDGRVGGRSVLSGGGGFVGG